MKYTAILALFVCIALFVGIFACAEEIETYTDVTEYEPVREEEYNYQIEDAVISQVESMTVFEETSEPMIDEIIDADITADEWYAQHAGDIFPVKLRHENISESGNMGLGGVSKYWIDGGIDPTYAYVSGSSSMMMMNQPYKFSFNIGGFNPARIVYSIYSQEYDSEDEYYYADVYNMMITTKEVVFTPEYAGRYFLLVYAYDQAGNYVYFDSSTYETAYSWEAGNISTVYGKAKSIVDSVTDSLMDDLEKALALHDWIVSNVSYATSGTSLVSSPVYHPVGALINGQAVCQGYSEAYQLLLAMVGIESVLAISDSGNHEWNLVKIYGKWYHIDCLWDDPVGAPAGYIGYTYFGLTDAQLKALDPVGHAWNERDTSNAKIPPSATATLKVSFSNDTELSASLRNLGSLPSLLLVSYEGYSTSSQLSAIRSAVSAIYPGVPVDISQHGRMYAVSKNGAIGATATPTPRPTATPTPRPVITGIVVESFIEIDAGQIRQIGMTYTPSSATNTVRYSSSNAGVASVDNTTGLIRALQSGVTTITAKAGNVEAKCSVVVHGDNRMVLPAVLSDIGAEAFSGSGFAELTLHEGVRTIAARAFADCRQLKIVELPGSITSIAVNAFANDSGCTIVCVAGSYAESYARTNGIPYVTR